MATTLQKLIQSLPIPYGREERALIADNYLSTQEAASKLKVSERTIRNMILRGSIYAYKLDETAKSIYRIPRSEIDRILKEREQQKQPG